MSKLMWKLDYWETTRQRTVRMLRKLADDLQSAHRENARTEQDCAVVTLAGDLAGLSGVLLAPFSGGLSLVFTVASAATGIGSFAVKKQANSETERTTEKIDRRVKQALKEDNMATDSLRDALFGLQYLEMKMYEKRIGDILISVQEATVFCMEIEVNKLQHSEPQYSGGNKESTSSGISVLGISQHAANFKAALTSAKEVIEVTQITKQTLSQTKTIQQIISTARSVNQVSKAANDLSKATLAIQASTAAVKYTKEFATVARGSDSIVKSAGVVSSAVRSTKVAAQLTTKTGQIASATASITRAAKSAQSLSVAQAGRHTIETTRQMNSLSKTAKTVTEVALDSDKVLKTTKLTRNATAVSKVSQTATKAASISKVGLAINAVVIPLDIYTLVKATDNMNKTHEDVKQIRRIADELESTLKSVTHEIKGQIESFKQLHVQLMKVYEDHHIEVIFDFLWEMYIRLDFTLPVSVH